MNKTVNAINTPLNSSTTKKYRDYPRQQKLNRSIKVKSNVYSYRSNNSFAVFKYLIVTTSIVFTFGGLGFGLAWRYGHDLQLFQSKSNVDSSPVSVNSSPKQ
jgi:hypothetical protein